MVTVDTPEWGRLERDVRNQFHLPPGLAAVNLLPSDERGEVFGQSGAGMGQAFTWMLDASVTWKDIVWLKSLTKLPVVLKRNLPRRRCEVGAGARRRRHRRLESRRTPDGHGPSDD